MYKAIVVTVSGPPEDWSALSFSVLFIWIIHNY